MKASANETYCLTLLSPILMLAEPAEVRIGRSPSAGEKSLLMSWRICASSGSKLIQALSESSFGITAPEMTTGSVTILLKNV
jgi:hypothetical protein